MPKCVVRLNIVYFFCRYYNTISIDIIAKKHRHIIIKNKEPIMILGNSPIGRRQKDLIGHRVRTATSHVSNSKRIVKRLNKNLVFVLNFKLNNCSSKMRQQMIKLIIRCPIVKKYSLSLSLMECLERLCISMGIEFHMKTP